MTLATHMPDINLSRGTRLVRSATIPMTPATIIRQHCQTSSPLKPFELNFYMETP